MTSPQQPSEPSREGSPSNQASATLDEALRVSEEQFRLLVESATEYAIFLLDPHGRVASWNAGAERIKGYRADEIIGRHFSTFYTPEDVTRGKPAEVLATARNEGRFEEEAWRVRKGGARFLASVVVTPLYDPNGTLIGYSKITRDMTNRRRREEERLERAREQMAHAFLREILFSVTEGKLRFCETDDDLPSPADPKAEFVPFTRATLPEVRRRTQAAAIAAGLPRDRWQDLMTGVGEAAMNAVVHATGARARIGITAEGTVQVWIADSGKGIDVARLPRATLERGFTTWGGLGHGFWLMLQTCDRLWLRTGADGTTVVLEQDCQPPEPHWFQDAGLA